MRPSKQTPPFPCFGKEAFPLNINRLSSVEICASLNICKESVAATDFFLSADTRITMASSGFVAKYSRV